MSDVQKHKSHTKVILIILALIITIVSAVVYFGVVVPQRKAQLANPIRVDGVYLTTPKVINAFNLRDNLDHPFTEEALKGHWTMLFFGFTNCAMVCPTTLSAFNGMYQKLQRELPDNQLPEVVFVSVDPARDSRARINEYVTSFNKHFKGARGSDAETAALTSQLHIAVAKMQAEGADKDQYSVNHTAEILVVNPNGDLQAYLSYPHTADQLVKDYKSLLKNFN